MSSRPPSVFSEQLCSENTYLYAQVSTMHGFVTLIAKREQIVFYVSSLLTSEHDMVAMKCTSTFAVAAPVAVPVQYLLDQQGILLRR
jgi:hypothetical protein